MQQSGIVASTPLLGFEIDCFVLFPSHENGDNVYGITVYYVCMTSVRMEMRGREKKDS
jgi:hypothetical protein